MKSGELLQDELLIADGAMGTYYYEKYKDSNPETQNLTHPERIVAIHKEYLKAGARLLRTNTFATNLDTLLGRQREKYTRKEQLDLLAANAQAAWEHAAAAVEETGIPAVIAGDIGPIHQGSREDVEILEEYCCLADALIEAGARVLWFETFGDMRYILPAAAHAKEKNKDVFVMASFCLNKFGYTHTGIRAAALIRQVKESSWVDGIGFNCGVGPAHMYQLLKHLDFGELPVAVLPNSGYGDLQPDRKDYRENAVYFRENMERIAGLGIQVAGGCCGTSPEYIRQLSSSLPRTLAARRTGNGGEEPGKGICRENNLLYQKLARGEKPIVVELDPPPDGNCEKLISGALMLGEAGVDMLTFSDSPMGKLRTDSILTAAKIHQELGLPVMPHVTCRDKNGIAMGGAFFGAHMNGIRNLLLITGDPVPSGDRSSVSGVFDFNSMKLMEYLGQMNQEYFREDPIVYGGALNQGRANLDAEIARVRRKQEAGADYFLTQPVFSREDTERIARVRRETGAKILCGIMPLVSYRNALFMKNEVFGIHVPQEIVERYRPDMSREEAQETGISIALEMIEALQEIADGYYFMVPFQRTEMICTIMKRMKETCLI